MRAVLPCCLVLLLFGLSGCAQEDPVDVLLADLEEAAEDRDADAIGELLTADFTSPQGGDKTAVVQAARQYLAAYQALDVEFSGVEINRRGPTARAKFRAKLSGVPTSFGGLGDLVPRQATYDFDVSARDDDGTWRLSSVSWSEVSE